MQRGQIFKRHGAWHLRYRVDGKQVSRKLAEFCDEYRTVTSVRQLADDILQPINQGRQSTGRQTLQHFIEASYLPHAKLHKRPSTHRGCKNLYNRYIALRVGGVRMSSFRTRDAQTLLNEIAAEGKLSHLTLIHIKSFLSGVFSFAKRMGSFDGANPIEGTEVPKGEQSQATYAYSNKEVEEMRKTLKGVSRVAVTVAAYTGLSLGELQGLKWEDLSSEQLNVNRTIWHGIEGLPKTDARKNAVPLLPTVRKELADHREKNPATIWVFEGPYARPLDLATLGSKNIKTALASTAAKWKGWHALRRGFATRLHEAGVQDKIIQSLMRHSSLSVTMKHYVKALPAANIEAMQKLAKQSRK
jgi:integrase